MANPANGCCDLQLNSIDTSISFHCFGQHLIMIALCRFIPYLASLRAYEKVFESKIYAARATPWRTHL